MRWLNLSSVDLEVHQDPRRDGKSADEDAHGMDALFPFWDLGEEERLIELGYTRSYV